MSKRIYFLTSEIVPFAETYSLASFSKQVPNVFIKNDVDFRVMMPKYGFISERRYILREIIRLRDMELEFMGENVDASVKSAFVPNTKVQVYFLENEDYYKPTSKDLYNPDTDGKKGKNSVRFGYFASAALATLNYLRWKPEIIICNDWQMSLLPMFVESGLLDDKYFNDVKIIQIVHSKTDNGIYSEEELEGIGLEGPFDEFSNNGKINSLIPSMELSDRIVFINKDENLLEKYQDDDNFSEVIDNNEEKICSFKQKGSNQEDWEELANEIDEVIDELREDE